MANDLKEFYKKEEESIIIPKFKYKKESKKKFYSFDLVFYALILIMTFSLSITSSESIITNNTANNLERNKEKIFSAIKKSTVYFYNKEDI